MKKLIFWVTGNIWVGKTYLCEKLTYLVREKKGIHKNNKLQKLSLHLLNIDEIRRNILMYSQDKEDISIRKELVKKLNIQEYGEDYSINGAVLGDIIFFDKLKMDIYKEIINPRLIYMLETEIEEVEGIILLEWAMLVEDNMLDLVENNVIVVNCNDDRKQERMKGTDLPEDQLQRRIDMQTSYDKLVEIIEKKQKKDNKWILMLVDTTNNPKEEFYIDIFDKLKKYYEWQRWL